MGEDAGIGRKKHTEQDLPKPDVPSQEELKTLPKVKEIYSNGASEYFIGGWGC